MENTYEDGYLDGLRAAEQSIKVLSANEPIMDSVYYFKARKTILELARSYAKTSLSEKIEAAGRLFNQKVEN